MNGTIRRSRLAPSALFALAATVLLVAPLSQPAEARRPRIDRQEFHDDMRRVWEDHITWTRLFIVSAAADLPDLDATTARLLANQSDIAQTIRPFYGRAAANQLEALLTDHILGAADVLVAAKTADTAGFDEALAAWHVNGNQIADFLSGANPDNWPKHHMRAMMREHLDLTLNEAAHRLGGEFELDVADYDAIHDSILEMADMLSDGIVAQFPGRFTR